MWRAVDHEGEVLECYVTKRRNKATAKKFLIQIMRKHGSPKIITTDKLASYGAAFREIGVVDRQLESKQSFKQKRTTALTEWFQICAS